jgi:tetratricopeptide (TPR) repeat protein
MLSPFLQQKHDVKAIKRALAWSLEKELRRENPTAQVNRTEIEYYIDQMLQRVDPAVSAWIAHSEGRFVAAQDSYRKALSQSNNKAYLRADLARLLVLMGRFPDARDEMTLALEELRTTDQEKLIRIYESKALYEHSIGLILEQLGDQAGAREAYARALQEDLSYYPSHIRLGDLALSAGDTATALTELELAVQIRGEDAGIRYMHAELLFRAGHFEAAAAESMEAIALEPLFALPYLLLAESIYAQGRHMDAAPHYREFLDRATRRAPEREQVKLRLAEIAANVSQEGSK